MDDSMWLDLGHHILLRVVQAAVQNEGVNAAERSFLGHIFAGGSQRKRLEDPEDHYHLHRHPCSSETVIQKIILCLYFVSLHYVALENPKLFANCDNDGILTVLYIWCILTNAVLYGV
jgi:hypothetical protein